MEVGLSSLVQVLVAGGLLNVWLIRARMPTAYRGGESTNIVEEFAAYGLPAWFCYLVGFLKVTGAIALLTGVVYPHLIFPAAVLLSVLMIGAVTMHFKIGDSIKKTLPAISVGLLCLLLVGLNCK